MEALTAPQVTRYLDRLGFDEPPAADLAGLVALQRRHLTVVPFENLDVYAGRPVHVELAWSFRKVVEEGRGGWCFELNGVFAALLDALGFRVERVGAAVLLGGPTALIDHLALVVAVDGGHRLVDVGFGDGFTAPLDLATADPQPDGERTYQLLASPQGTTLAMLDDDGVPAAQYRFSRVARQQSDFEAASRRLQDDKTLHWHQRRFATRLIEDGPGRVTLNGDRLRLSGVSGEVEDSTIADDAWEATHRQWFRG